ncbi:nitroreductase [Burkholderia stagnalis]|uniref:Nitrobenzoate reductase n=1 Tax=Burkholderia stagnalis TaxID=1503054 RepID=A0A119CVH2_9BURK|nr:nitroreductase [Burkholderia stagnalis]AOK54090.1 nitrobenzoate reductase [Burkholderia stagnalis]KAB0633024.1 nitroreductase [Burkholderia stagnalis]KVL87138.1 nitrobenzoate reductase [Burkholderia stagnalis]KVL98732.1 nitrobenzoate reductase [Burkholderia stagnalis]KVM13293.1 nitrobenzoate reductase [Burkholderia stagnalis]
MSVPAVSARADADAIRAVDDALTTRRAIRAFLPTPVPRDTLEAILEAASRAPSGTNIQPWRVYVATGATRDALADALAAAYDDPARDEKYVAEYDYYPREWISPYIDRRRKVGWDLYSLLEIRRDEKDRMHAQHARNFRFFDAPVALFFTLDRVMTHGAWLDCGMFLQGLMTAARARGLDTCPQAAFVPFHRVVAAHLGIPDHEQLVCGMSLGHADPAAIENRLVTERAPVAEFARFFA